MKLSEIKKVPLSKLKVNKDNQKYFRQESGSYYDNLLDDIKKRGFLVPLIAKQDGTLLAGHNRLLIAKTLKKKKVPVQYVEGKITKEEEQEYIIKDNLLRRHLTPAERRELYKIIIKDFEEKVMITRSLKVGVNTKELAEKTGLNPKTIGYDMARIRREKAKEQKETMEIDVVNEKAVEQYQKAVRKMINIAIIEKGKTLDELYTLTEMAWVRLQAIKGDIV
jgi:ParB-like chromosome segregation protein Spo0J